MLSANYADEQVMLHFLAKENHPFCSQKSQYSLISDVMLMMLRRPKFVRILIDQIGIDRTILTITRLINRYFSQHYILYDKLKRSKAGQVDLLLSCNQGSLIGLCKQDYK